MPVIDIQANVHGQYQNNKLSGQMPRGQSKRNHKGTAQHPRHISMNEIAEHIEMNGGVVEGSQDGQSSALQGVGPSLPILGSNQPVMKDGGLTRIRQSNIAYQTLKDMRGSYMLPAKAQSSNTSGNLLRYSNLRGLPLNELRASQSN